MQATAQGQTQELDPTGESVGPVHMPAVSSSTIESSQTNEQQPVEPRRSSRERRQPERFVALVEPLVEPTSYKDAMKTPNAKEWNQACVEEMKAQDKNRSWSLTYLPQGRKLIKSRWVFKRKTDSEGNLGRFRACLVAKGFSQIAGVDYSETFAPVARHESIRLLLSIAARENLIAQQWDIKTAFLYGLLDGELYMAQPEGFVDMQNSNKVCKLHKAIYGLKQAGRRWNVKLSSVLKQFKFKQCLKDESIFVF